MPAQIPRFDSSDPRLRDEALPFRAPKTHADSIVGECLRAERQTDGWAGADGGEAQTPWA